MIVVREFSVGLTARICVSPGSNIDEAADKAAELLDVLEEDPRAMGPVTWCNADPPTVGARFNVHADTAEAALTRAREILADATDRVGLGRHLDLIEVEIEEFHEEELQELLAQFRALAEDDEEEDEEDDEENR